MQTVVIVIHLMIVAVMIGAVLLQKSEGGGLGMGGGAGFMSSRGTANLLTRTTAILAGGFFVTSLFLSWYAGYDRKPASIIGAFAATVRRCDVVNRSGAKPLSAAPAAIAATATGVNGGR